jgi:endonuclease/exonuclease/phosphatase family metal-dependent hydrolase
MVFKKNDGGAINIKELLSSIQIDKTYPNSVCIMNYNVQWFSGRNANTVLQNAILDKYNPDIIGLQEFRENIAGIPVWKTLFRNYGYTHTTRDGNVNYKGLASKIPFGTVEDKAFVNQYTEQRGYSKTYLNINGKNVCWINAHTDLDESTKVAQCKEVFGLVANEEYFIITGDFNTDYCFSTDDEEYKTIMKQFIDAGYHSANCSEQHGFLGTYCGAPTISGYNSGKMRPDDHIITSSNITIDKVFADDTKTMEMFVDENNIDHFPLVAFITIN